MAWTAAACMQWQGWPVLIWEVRACGQIRRQLRARRLAQRQAQVAAVLAEKQAAEAAEAAEKEHKVQLRDELKARMKAWQQVRMTLSSLHRTRVAALMGAFNLPSADVLCSRRLGRVGWTTQPGAGKFAMWACSPSA